MSNQLVKVNKYSKKIKLLSVYSRIETNISILVRPMVAKMLANVAEQLPNNLQLQVDGGYRTPNTQRILWNNRTKELGVNKAKDLVANPGSETSGHLVGGAVDVSLLDLNGKEINLSEPFKKYYDEQKLYSKKITKRAQKLRLILYKAMLSAGFAPHDNEYWHFSYGDKRWADFYNKKVIYKIIKNPNKYYYPLFTRIFIKISRKTHQVINKTFKIKTNY